MKACKQHKATLVVAKLDRLSRKTRHLLGTVERGGVDVCFCDFPQVPPGAAGKFVLTMLAAAAELESGLASERTKAALKAAKARGVELGKHSKVLAPQNRAKALDFTRRIADRVRELQTLHDTVRDLTDALNREGVPTPRGARWHVQSTYRMLKRLEVLDQQDVA